MPTFSKSRLQVCAILFSSVLFAGLISCAGGNPETSANRPSPDSATAQLTVQTSSTAQTFEAWRATVNGPHVGTSIIPDSVLSRLLDDLAFDLGINGVRIEQNAEQQAQIAPGVFDFAKPFILEQTLIDPVARFQKLILPLKARVESRGEPFSTYVSPIYSYSEFPSNLHTASEYAKYAQTYVAWMRSTFNLVPTYWAIVNEPSAHFFSNNELSNDISSVAAAFHAIGAGTRIQTIETASPNPGSLQSVLSSPTVAASIGLVSFHGYDYSGASAPSFGSRHAIRDLAAQRGLRTAMTEICCKSGWDGSYTQALGWARDIYWNLTEANASIWEPLFLMGPFVVNPNLSGYQKSAAYYGLRQYAHYIRPGDTRVSVSCAGCTNSSLGLNVKAVAFQKSSGGYAVVVINDQDASRTIAIAGLPAGTYNISGVDPGSPTGRTYPAQTIGSGESLALTFPAQAIITFAR